MKLIAINSISYVNAKRKVATAEPGEIFEVDDNIGENLMGRCAARKLTKDELDLVKLRESEAKSSKKGSSEEEAPEAKAEAEAEDEAPAAKGKGRQAQSIVPDF